MTTEDDMRAVFGPPNRVDVIDFGDLVICDWCGPDTTDLTGEGGFTYGSKAICPHCAPKLMSSIVANGEEEMIEHRANPGESFKDFVHRLRGGRPGRMTISTFGPPRG